MDILYYILALAVLSATAGASTLRIINGNDAAPESLPYQVSLQYWYQGTWNHICGGSVIGLKTVLTAAHCVDGGNANEFRVVVYEHRLQEDDGTEQEIMVTEIKANEDYYGSIDNEGRLYPNDIAILFLQDNVKNQEAIIPIATKNNFGDFANVTCTISGWGLNDSFGYLANTLQEVNMTVLTQEECIDIWGYSIFPGQICIFAGPEVETGATACNGDSGGPMVCEGVLAGVASWGVYGCISQISGEFLPSVYARVSHYQEWIQLTDGLNKPWRG